MKLNMDIYLILISLSSISPSVSVPAKNSRVIIIRRLIK